MALPGLKWLQDALPRASMATRKNWLANLDQTKEHRRAFHEWRCQMYLEGRSSSEAGQRLEDTIQRYRNTVRKTKIVTGVKYAFAVVTAAAGAGAAAVVTPAVGYVGAFAGLGSFAIAESGQKKLPKELQVAAMFHDARKQFGWYQRRRR